MDSKIFKFNKPYEKRYKEYSIILRKSNGNVSTLSDVALVWSNYLEFSLEPRGWNAFWNILRDQCNKLNVCFPKVVLIKVNDIDYSSLTADVSLADINEALDEFPRRVGEVPLKDLYVTYEQENQDLDVTTTAECLDQLRIFYHHLWWPWDDVVDAEYKNWVTYHLENRLKLYYDKLEGKVHYVSGKIIKNLIESSQEIYAKLKVFCNGNSIFEVDQKIVNKSSFDVAYINELYNELELNKSKLNQWEIAEIRKISDENIKKLHRESGIFVVVKDCCMKNVAKYVIQVPNTDSSVIRIKDITNSLEDSLLNYSAEDIIFIAPGIHQLTNREYFDFPITIKGLGEDGEVTISDERSYCNYCERGTVHLNSVIFENQNFRTSRAIYIYKNGTLLAEKCTFLNFDIAIICMEGSTLRLVDCTFENNDSCIEIADGANITLNNCDLCKTKKAPFRYEEDTLEEQYESLQYLSNFEHIKLDMVKVADENNAVELI